ncbi:ABC transporter family protein [Paraburkholderia xenovorans LB400]|uniref:Amino acid/amide ABC transporter ATP-binding protein 1, HAAT family n=1 Tax=Paraburkholderia xenovorans (strain LB400) TaxID=266265 RepID=Q13HN7_PARXL|nr:ABC transporter ATP-binding protein [Paraburkholderia xenovorans]ABE36402.1 amino acid/amide ABC transporter ATP-binding protein 1, HAAT family [Paraburkholderia xenovorans LB400]AIP34146.1 ABC transporter family protein [Paraburkholderia xenovorans LB400]
MNASPVSHIAGSIEPSPVLLCENISVDFAGFQALREVTVSVRSGQTIALIGPNGAGKSTLMNVMSGLLSPTAGSIRLHDRDVTSSSPSKLARLGVARSFQNISLFASMTVYENLRLAVQRQLFDIAPFWKPVAGYRRLNEATDLALERSHLTTHRNRLAAELSHGQQRALDLGMTLIGDPKILLLDEPLAGVGHDDLDFFLTLLRKVCSNRTVLLVEHNMDAVMGLADEVVVLVGGQVLTKGSPAEIRANPKVRESYLGSGEES